MYHLDLTLETPAANVALDEQLLERAEAGALPGEVLRTWESPQLAAVLGRSSPAHEVRAADCSARGVAVLRRASGGATVLLGPGCLMYAVVLDLGQRPELRAIDRAHALALGALTRALAPLDSRVIRAGTSDLALAEESAGPPRKFSGNSLRIKRRHLLYHGTVLYDFPLDDVSRLLAAPVREPEYRQRRSHVDFLANFPAPRAAIVAALRSGWQAHEPLPDLPQALGRKD